MICACDSCKSEEYKIGLCLFHIEEMEQARSNKILMKWRVQNNIYVSTIGIYRNGGKIISDVCKCKNTYMRPTFGSLHLCPECLRKLYKDKWTKQNKKRRAVEKLKRGRKNDPNMKTYFHYGLPKTTYWECNYPNCENKYKVVLTKNKNKYPSFCKKHMGLR